MLLCIPHRFYIALMCSFGFFLINSFKVLFNLSIAHATIHNSSALEAVKVFLKCSTTGTNRDFQDKFETQLTLLLTAVFFTGSNIGTVLGSIAANRYPAGKIMFISIAIESLLHFCLPAACRTGCEVTLSIIRFLCGLCDGAYQPSMIFVIGSWAFPTEKSRAVALSLIGRTLGGVFASIITATTMCYLSWNSGFYIFGSLGLLWSTVWLYTSYSVPNECPELRDEEKAGYVKQNSHVKAGCEEVAKHVPYKAILTSKAVWSIWFCRMASSWTSTTIYALQPLYFKDAFNFSMSDLGLLVCFQPLIKICFLWTGASVSHKLVSNKLVSVTNTRKLMQTIGGLLEGSCLLGILFSVDWRMTFLCFFLASAAGGLVENGHRCNQVDLSLQYANVVAGLAMTGMIGAVVNSLSTYFIHSLGQFMFEWHLVFLINGSLSIAASLVYAFFASGEVQPWDTSYELLEKNVLSEDEDGEESCPLMKKNLEELND